MQKIHIFHLCYVIGHEASIAFDQKTWHQACLVFMSSALKKTTTKTYFLCYEILVKTLCTVSYVLLHWNISIQLRIVTRSRFQLTRVVMKLTTFFISRTKQIYRTFQKGNVILGTIRNFAYINSHLQTNILEQK